MISEQMEKHKLCVGEGWHPILASFAHASDCLIGLEKMPSFDILQVKEKFGTLRIYISGGDSQTDAMIRVCETLSSFTCEECGAPASTNSIKGWWRTVCEDCI